MEKVNASSEIVNEGYKYRLRVPALLHLRNRGKVKREEGERTRAFVCFSLQGSQVRVIIEKSQKYTFTSSLLQRQATVHL